MRNKRVLVLLLGLSLMLAVVACDNKEIGKKSDDEKTEETAQSEIEDDKADVEGTRMRTKNWKILRTTHNQKCLIIHKVTILNLRN